MDPANYQPCGARLSQGDIAIAPIGVFASVDDLEDRRQLDRVGAVLSAENPDGVALAIPARGPLGEDPIVLRAWYRPALVVSADCVIQRADEVLIAPIHPLDDAQPRSWDGIRAGRFRTALYLPPDPAMEFPDGSQAPWPESYVDLDRTTSVSPRLLRPARLAMLSPDGRDRLHFQLARYLITEELSARGNLAAAVGKRVTKSVVVASSSRRHTVVLTFEDGSTLVVYQEPRQDAYCLESVTIKDGRFNRPAVQVLTGQRLILRVENEDRREWSLWTKALPFSTQRIRAANTTEFEVPCPSDPCQVPLMIGREDGQTLSVNVLRPPRG